MEQWLLPDELPRQIQLGRGNPDIDGGIFFRAASTLYGDLGVRDSLRAAFSTPALLPTHQHEEGAVPAAPRFRKAKARRDGTLLKWKFGKGDRKNRPYYYVVYRFKNNQPADLDQPGHILHLTRFGTGKRRYKFMDTTAEPEHTYTYMITGISRTHREGPPSERAGVKR
jgi:hypothetical protein